MVTGKKDPVKANQSLVRRRFSQLDKKDFSVLDELFDPSYVLHFSGMPEPMNLQTTKQLYTMLYSAFPDLHHTIDEQIGAGNKVVTRWTARGTHQGDWMGIPPTGKRVTLHGINIYTLRRGKLSESHVNWDILGLLHQLGIVSHRLQVSRK
jgi:steroid delta-isomerase-like uncharacterized protein